MTAKQQYEEFLKEQKKPGYKLGDITGTPDGDMVKYTELKISVKQEEEKIRLFNEAKDKAFESLRTKQDAEMQELGKQWSIYESNDYEIPQ